MTNSRFVSNIQSEFQQSNRSPILDCEDTPVLTLEEAVTNIVPLLSNVMDHVATAKTKCIQQSTLLTQDESAAIYLYTMSVKLFYSGLNKALRAANRQLLKPWLTFLKLFITALEKLPSTKTTIWRGVNYDATLDFVENGVVTWWNINSCSMNINSVQPFLGENGTLFAIEAVHGKDISMFSAIPDEQEVILMPGTRVRAKNQSFNFIDRLFIIHVEQINIQSESDDLFEQIKEEYRRNSRIERFMNPSISYPIEQSYINLAIVEAKEQLEKEKQLRDAQNPIAVMGTFEEIYDMKTAIDVKNIFKTCKNDEKQVLVFGRAGIGKSTFCQYVTYKWATGSYWVHYELLAFIPLRHLSADRYPPLSPGQTYSLLDLVKKELFRYDLSDKEQEILKNQFDARKTLWILDGYDEIIQNVPPHLQCLLKQLLKTQHHIITSRPYLNTLSYDVQMEITGFTDDNIKNYVENFFDQMKKELGHALLKGEKLFSFLKSNSRIWGIAHIPVNLELICSLWSNEDWSETEQLTMTTLYTMMTEWLCRRYLRTHDNKTPQFTQHEIEQYCQKELAFLEILAFNSMKDNIIVIQPALLQKAWNEAKVSSQNHPHILNIGILKSFHQQGIGNQIQTKRDHYFVHLSFQEYFAARYLINALQKSRSEKAIDFIKYEKYNQRYTLVFNFAAGLLSESDAEPSSKIFWDCILGEPLDLVGIRHMQLVISCMEETTSKSAVPQRSDLLESIASCIMYTFTTPNDKLRTHLTPSLQRAQSVICEQTITNVLINLLQHNHVQTKQDVLSFIAELKISNPSLEFITAVTTALEDKNEKVKEYACRTLKNLGEKAAINEVISMLISALGDQSDDVRQSACEALKNLGEKAATNEVISKLVSALGNENDDVRRYACRTLRNIGEKAAMNEVISKLVSALGDQSDYVRHSACIALGKIGEKTVTNEVISKLVSALADQSDYVRRYACRALGNIGEKAATNEVINKLASALGNENDDVRRYACRALGNIGEKAATNEVISSLISALGDQSDYVREYACIALGKICEKAATNEVISKLVSALGNENDNVRRCACRALGNIGEKAATNEVISKLASALVDQSDYVIQSACEALGKIGEKAATNEVISKLVSALGNENDDVRQSACTAVGNLGEKAATNEVISNLASALGDHSDYVRRRACRALANIGEKAATNEVINKLASALGDERDYVREYAYRAVGGIGGKAATNEVINKLASALGDQSDYVRRYACETLGKIGEKAATNEVISKLVGALGDESDYVREYAYRALGRIGGEAATNEVISMLISALGHQSDYVRQYACEALGNIGEKAATNEVNSKLASTLVDQSDYVIQSACEALGKIGEKAATNEVISKLVSALGNENDNVRQSACVAVGNLGEKAATNEVISKLASALGDQSDYVRRRACKALGNLGKKAATKEVINKLISALGDQSDDVREYACKALGNMGEKAATNEVISKIIAFMNNDNYRTHYVTAHAVASILSSSSVMAHIDPKVIADLCLHHDASQCLRNISEQDLIEIFFHTRSADWLSVMTLLGVLKGVAVIAMDDKVVIYDMKEPTELLFPSSQLRHELIAAFTAQGKRLHLYFKTPPEVSEDPSIFSRFRNIVVWFFWS